MSGEATGYVWRYSTATDKTFTIHLAVADIANDAYDWRVWLPVGAIAEKSRASRATTFRALAWLVDQGYLERLTPDGVEGEAVEYRFLTPSHGETGGVARRYGGVSHGELPLRTTALERKDQRKGTQSVDAAFDEFWQTYPRKVGKRKAREEFARALTRAPDQRIIRGAIRYRDDPNRVLEFTAHPSTWLHRDGWDDDPLPARGGSVTSIADKLRAEREGMG